MRAEEFDQKFNDGEDITGDLDLAAIHRPALEQRRVNVDFPSWMVDSLDREARRLGVTRQSIIRCGSPSDSSTTTAPLPDLTSPGRAAATVTHGHSRPADQHRCPAEQLGCCGTDLPSWSCGFDSRRPLSGQPI
jgi:hypothetical protein